MSMTQMLGHSWIIFVLESTDQISLKSTTQLLWPLLVSLHGVACVHLARNLAEKSSVEARRKWGLHGEEITVYRLLNGIRSVSP